MFNRISRDEQRRLAALSMAVDVCGERGDFGAVLEAARAFRDFLSGDAADPIAARRRGMLRAVDLHAGVGY